MRQPILIASLLTTLSAQQVSASNLSISTPSQACNAMDALDLATSGWKNRYEELYGCSSPYKDIGNGYPLPNNLAFYAEGNKGSVSQVKIVLNFNDRSNTKAAYVELQNAAALLIKKFAGSDMPPQAKTAIASNKNLTLTINRSTVIIEKINWPTGGYEIQITIN